MKIISFPFAGGSKHSYQKFIQQIPEFHVLELAGRGSRLNEELCRDMDTIVHDMLQRVGDLVRDEEDFILYGHSLGALIAFLVARGLEQSGRQKPLKLIVSGKKSPLLKPNRYISHLPDEEFWQEIIAIGGIPKELIDHSELIEFYLPILRADFISFETFDIAPIGKVSIPIDAFYGSTENVTREEMINWDDVTSNKLNIYQLAGDHFFIYDHIDHLTAYFRSQLKTCTQA